MKLVLLSSNTQHHWYFINKLKNYGIIFDSIIFETTFIKAKFDASSPWEKKQLNFEKKRWKKLVKPTEKIKLVKNINSLESLDFLKELGPKIGIVFGTRKLGKDILNIFNSRLLNIHRGIAQEYRGLDCEFWPIYHKDFTNIGVTIHKVDNSLDTGDVVFQKRLNISRDVYCYNLRAYTTELALKMIVKILTDYKKDKKFKKIRQKKIGRYYSFMPSILKKSIQNNIQNYINVKSQ